MKKLIIIIMLLIAGMIYATQQKAVCLDCLWDLTCYSDNICGRNCFCYRPEKAYSGECLRK